MLCLVAGGTSFNALLCSENKVAAVICTPETPTIPAAEPMEAAQRLPRHDPSEQAGAQRPVALEAADWACVIAMCCQQWVLRGSAVTSVGAEVPQAAYSSIGAHNALTHGEGPFRRLMLLQRRGPCDSVFWSVSHLCST